MDEIKAIPRNRYIGMLADALGGVKNATGPVGDLFIGDAPRTLNQMSYGFSPVRMGRTDQGLAGALYGMQVDPGLMDVAGVAGMLPGAGRVAGWAGKEGLRAIDSAMLGNGNKIVSSAISGVRPRSMMPSKISNETELWHGGYGPLDEVKDNTGIFDGVFASPSRTSAASHGQDIFRTSIPDEKILTQRSLDYDLDPEVVMDALRKTSGRSGDDLNDLYRFVVEEGNVFDSDAQDIQRLFGLDDLGEASWEAQRLRGKLAKELGYSAVEMSDEHGTSYLVLPGIKFAGE